ncbi:MAG: choice-of-anchor J domain-containing protein [Bacteroidetes bacterium]|nr:choice-of-anchor J domain-containing protein [Bacteroidota bacterium]MBS1931614.1 choice-of-anchor J domain-containing protein [Bacteroidota bacterium]
MKRILFFYILLFLGTKNFAQTNPTPQSLPYTQDFSSFNGSVTTYPAGWQGWTITGSTSTSYSTAAPSGDQALIGAANSNTSAFVGDMNTKIGMLNTSSALKSICLALNTTGLGSISVSYSAATQRQQIGNRIGAIGLQYRVGTSGAFTNITGTDYQNPGGSDNMSGTGSLSPQTITITLPNACENQSNLQLRWVYKEVSGSGNRPGFSVTNVSISGSAISNSATLSAGTDMAEPATNGTFTINISPSAPAGGTTVSYALTGTAVAGTDYTDPNSGSVFIAAGATSSTVTLNVVNNPSPQPNETITMTLTGATNGVSANSTPATINRTDAQSTQIAYYSFNSCSGSVSDGFTQYSVTGAQTWACYSSGYIGSAVYMNGYSGGTNNVNEDWLISPALNLTSTNIPLLSYYCRNSYAGLQPQLLVSTNYSGSGDPNLATWTQIDGHFPIQFSDTWTLCQNINLSSFKTTNVYFAFKYNSTSTAASRIILDEIYILNSTVSPSPTLDVNSNLLDFRYQPFGSTSASKSFEFWGNDFTSNLTLMAPANFELSKDNSTFSNSLNYTPTDLLNQQQTVYVHYTSPANNDASAGKLTFNSGIFNEQYVLLKANSYTPASTLNVVNWNMEWFGSSVNGPTDKNLQQANAQTTLQYLNADIYALEEVVDTNRLKTIVSNMPGYAYKVSYFCSGAPDTSSAYTSQYNSGQKLAFVYNTAVVSNVSARGMLQTSSNYANAYNDWASGRFPYVVTATTTKNGGTNNFEFYVVHNKAGSDQISYYRRRAGNQEMKDSLDAFHQNSNIIILGDYNDDLDISIYRSPNTPTGDTASSWDMFVKDSTGANSYKSLTLPLSEAKLHSTYDNGDVIDNVIVSNEVSPYYVPYTATLFDDIETVAGIPNFSTTTSDHFPVMSRYSLPSILPVKLILFEAEKQNTEAKIYWTTTNEIDLDKFIVEHSADGIQWQAIKTVMPAGLLINDYTVYDASPVIGVNYYRLKSVDKDGTFSYSAIRKVIFGDPGFTYSIYPNPAKDLLQLSVTNPAGFNCVVKIINSVGEIVLQKTINTSSASTQIPVNTLTSGMYYLNILDRKGNEQVMPFIKQ